MYYSSAQVYCLDVQFVAEMPKFIAGCMTALSAMVQLELPHVNVLTKMDLCKNKVGANIASKHLAQDCSAWFSCRLGRRLCCCGK